MIPFLIGLSIAMTIVFGILYAVARFMFRTPIEFDQHEMLPTDWEKRG